MRTLIATGHVIPAKAGIEKSRSRRDGFRVKPGMTNSRKFMSLGIVSFFLLLDPATAAAAKISPKKVGNNNQALQRLAEGNQTDEGSEKGSGSKEIERRDGQRDKVYYSTTTKEEEAERRQEEKEKVEKSLDILRNMIIVPKPTH